MSAQYFAQINDENVCTSVHVVQREFLEANPERYQGRWVETFIDDTHTYAGVGFIYNEETQDFELPFDPEPVEP